MIISGAYGRDYGSKAKILMDVNSDRDFVLRDGPDDGRYINREDLPSAVNVRYSRDRKVCVIQRKSDGTYR